MAIQLRVLMSLVIAIVAITCIVVSFVPTYTVGVDSTVSAVSNLRANMVQLASERLKSYFAKPASLAQLMHYISHRGALQLTNWTAVSQIACDLALDHIDSFTTAAVVLPFEAKAVRCDTQNLQTKAFTGLPYIQILTDPTTFEISMVDNATHYALPNSVYYIAKLPATVPLVYVYSTTRMFLFNPTSNVIWGTVTSSWDTTQLTVGGKLLFPDGSYRGAVQFEIHGKTVGRFLNTLGLRSRARAIAWDDRNGATLGLSWDEATTILLPSWKDLTVPENLRAIMRPIDNFTDPLMQRVVSSLGGAGAVRNLSLPYVGVIGAGKKRVYVDIVSVADEFGLKLKILIAMPEIDFLEEVYDQQVKTPVGICLGVVVMIACAFAIGHFMSRPLYRLDERMRLTASLQDNEEDDPPSMLSEVRSMQQSYSLMKSELNRAKTYLPQSVMAVDNDEEDEDDTTANPSAEVSVRSREMVGSTRQPPVHGSDRQSTRSSIKRTAGAAAAGLNMSVGLVRKNVSIAVFNLQGFLPAVGSSTDRCLEIQRRMLAAVQHTVKEQRGVIDYFQGDRVFVSFNAVTNAASHGKRAAIAALTVIKELRADPQMPIHATAGISSGPALCGNMGTDDMRRFSIVGPPVVQAIVLERMTKLYPGVSVLMPGWMEADTGLEVYHSSIDIIRMPGGVVTVLLSAVAVKSLGSDEWMYELKEGEDADPFRRVNEGFRALIKGETDAAKIALSHHNSTVEAAALGAQKLSSLIELAANGEKPISHLENFYSVFAADAQRTL